MHFKLLFFKLKSEIVATKAEDVQINDFIDNDNSVRPAARQNQRTSDEVYVASIHILYHEKYSYVTCCISVIVFNYFNFFLL